MGSSWQHKVVAGLNGFAHNKFLTWLFGKPIRYRWSDEERTFVFYFDKEQVGNEVKEALKASYEKQFLIQIKLVD
jgi:hypothetical protein